MRTSTDTYTSGSDNWPYLGAPWPALSFVLRGLKHEGTFVDLGSGKGKAMLIAARLPYRRVLGVEIDEELAGIARRNIERARLRFRSGPVECVVASVRDFKIPDDASTIFMYNPFFGETFRDAMRCVFDSYDRSPRDMHIVYSFPWEHEWLLSTGRVAVEAVGPEMWPAPPGWWNSEQVTVIYHVTAEGQTPAACQARKGWRLPARRRALVRWRTPGGHTFVDPSTI